MPAASRKTAPDSISINRAPVLSLWAAVVAERLGYDPDEAATLGEAVSVLNARSKGRRLGIFAPGKRDAHDNDARVIPRQDEQVELLGRPVPIARTAQGVRAMIGGEVLNPQRIRRKLEQKLADAYPRVREAMEHVARSFRPPELATAAYGMYERFRPAIPAGTRGWGARGALDLNFIRSLAKRQFQNRSDRRQTSTSSVQSSRSALAGRERTPKRPAARTAPPHKGQQGSAHPRKDAHPDRAGKRGSGRRTTAA
jgi:hypothetical protein